MWPTADVSRIRAEIVAARARGICTQTDGNSTALSKSRKKHARIFDEVTSLQSEHGLEVIPPHEILLQRPPLLEQEQDQSEKVLDLVIDSAGKVRSVEPAGKVKGVDAELINAALAWKFIPAFKEGRPVASRLRITVTPKQ
jgi:hypothetical protein